MLTQNHLTILRAALQYFLEELMPHGPEAMQSYLDKPIEGDITQTEVQKVQLFLRNVDVKFAVLRWADPYRIESPLYDSLDSVSTVLRDKSLHVSLVMIPRSH